MKLELLLVQEPPDDTILAYELLWDFRKRAEEDEQKAYVTGRQALLWAERILEAR